MPDVWEIITTTELMIYFQSRMSSHSCMIKDFSCPVHNDLNIKKMRKWYWAWVKYECFGLLKMQEKKEK